MAKPKLGATYKNFKDIKARVERGLRGITSETEEILLPKDTGEELDDVLSSIIKTFAKGENSSISDINGNYNADMTLGNFIDMQFSNDRYKDILLNSMMSNTIDKIIEQQFMIRNMPQVNKVINSMTNATMSPSTQTRDTNEIKIKDSTYSASDVRVVLERKKFNKKERVCITNAYSYGAGFMMIYPYKEMACDILTNADVAHKKGYVDPNLFMAAKLSDTEKEIAKQLYGESFINEAEVIEEEMFSEANISDMLRNQIGHTEAKRNEFNKSIELIQESMNLSIDTTSQMESAVEKRFFSESPLNTEAAYEFKSALFAEAGCREIDIKRLKNLNGAYVKALEAEKTIPVYINDELVGVYYIDYDTDFSDQQFNLKKRDRFGARRRLSTLGHVGINADIKESIVNVLKRQLDEKFLANNKHVLASVDKIVRDARLDTVAQNFMIRWVPKKYVVEYANDDRRSQIAMVEPLIICWIILFRHYMMKKIFYEKDIRYIKYLVSEGDDNFGNQGFKALQAVRSMVPAPADILNYRVANSSQMAGNKIAIPVTRDGTAPFTMEKIEGQKPGEEDFADLMKLQGIITEEIGINWNMLDPASPTETATQIIASREDKAEMILNKQILFNPAKTEAINKIMEYETGVKDLKIEAKFPELKVIKNNIFADYNEKINGKLDSMIVNALPTAPDAKKAYVRSKLYKYYMSTVMDVDMIEEFSEQYEYDLKFGLIKDGTQAEGGEE